MEKNSHRVLHVIKKALLLHPLSQGKHSSLDDESQAPRGLPRRKKRKNFFEKAWSERKDGYLCHPEPKGSAARRRLKKVQKTLKKSWSERKDAYLCSPDSKEWRGLHSKTDTDEGAPSGATTIHRAAPGGGMNGPNVL